MSPALGDGISHELIAPLLHPRSSSCFARIFGSLDTIRTVSYIDGPVLIEDTAPPEHVTTVTEAFRRAGFDVEVAPIFHRKAADLLPWLVKVVVILPIGAFFTSFAVEGGKDAYGAVKEWIKDVSASRTGAGTGEGSLWLSDPDRTNLVLSSSLPDEAIEKLRDIDWGAKRGDYLVWNASRSEWMDPTKRA